MKMTSVVGLDTKKSKKEYRAEYFMEKNENDENVFELWLTKNKEALKINAYDVSNHPGILLRWPGIESLYDTMKPHFEKLVLQNGKKELDELDLYRFLVWTVSLHKRQGCGRSTGFEPIISPIEGNHRTGAHAHMLLGSSYDLKTGLLQVGTLKKEWIVENLARKPSRNITDIRAKYENIDLHELVKELIMDDNSALNKQYINMQIIYGKTREAFDKLNIGMSFVQSVDINFSAARMTDKHSSIAPPETTTLAEQGNIYLNLLEGQESLAKGESVNFSANASDEGRHYIEFSQDPIKRGKDMFPPPKCSVFNSKEWQALVNDPTPTNLRKHMTSISVGSVTQEIIHPPQKDRAKPAPKPVLVLKPTGNVRHPPFHLDVDNIFNFVGKIRRKKQDTGTSRKSKATSQSKEHTMAGKRIEQGLAHQPLSLEELMKGQFIALFTPACFRAHFLIPLSNWDSSPLKKECSSAVQYLIRTHVATEKANAFGQQLKPKDGWESEDWATTFGVNKERTPISTDCRYMAAALFLADTMVACLCLGADEGMKLARDVIDMLLKAHRDTNTGYKDKAIVDTLGTFH